MSVRNNPTHEAVHAPHAFPSAGSRTHCPVAGSACDFKGFSVPPILTWENPYATGSLLAQAVGLWVVFSSTFTLRVALRAFYWIVGVLSVVEAVSRKFNNSKHGIVSDYRPSRFLAIDDHTVARLSTSVSRAIKMVIEGIQTVLDAECPASGLALAAGAWLLRLLVGVISLKTVTLIAILFAFGLPPVYLQFKGPIDASIKQSIDLAHVKALELRKLIEQKLGPYFQFLHKLPGSGPRPSRQHINPVPTANKEPVMKHTVSSGADIHRVDADTLAHAEKVYEQFQSAPTFVGDVRIDPAQVKEPELR